MFKSYIKNACRIAMRQKWYSLLNITGLSISMAVAIPILLWIYQQMNFDRFNSNLARTVLMVMEKQSDTGRQILSTQPAPIAPRLKENIPEIETYVRTMEATGFLRHDGKSFAETITFTDPSILTVFTFPLRQGDSLSVLADRHSVVLSNRMAKKLFGDVDPIGKTLDLNQKVKLTVTGILDDIPGVSSLKTDVLVPLQQLSIYGKKDLSEWGGSDYTTWFLLRPGSGLKAVQKKVDNYCSDVFSELGWYDAQQLRFSLTPLQRLHLYGPAEGEGIVDVIVLLGAIALGLLLIACLNYSTLMTARVFLRSQEIGIRKTIGASRMQLLIQLIVETAVIIIASLFLAIVIAELCLPTINGLLNTDLEFRILQPSVLGVLSAITIITIIFSCLYPVFVFVKMKPIDGVYKKFVVGKSAKIMRYSSVIFQIAVSGFLLFSSTGIHKQMDYILEKDMGIDISNVINIRATPAIKEHFQMLKEELLRDPAIHSVSASELSICDIRTVIGSSWDFEGRDKNIVLDVHLNKVTADYANTLGIKILEGRFFSPEHPSDKENAVVLNRTAVELMGMEDPIGRPFRFWGWEMNVIGVMEDFHLQPLSEEIEPLVLINRVRPNQIYIKIDDRGVEQSLAKIQSALHKIDPASVPDYGFLEDRYSLLYADVNQLEDLMGISSSLAVVTACLGIFALVSFIAERKRHEIGIRKVLGASVFRVSWNVIFEVTLLALAGVLVSAPFGTLLINAWLKNFAYNSGIGIDVYFQTVGVIILMLSISVSYPVLKAATSNPVDALRSQ